MFSVIIPLHNKTDFILRAIDSVLQQNFTDFEIIVVNDGSTDGSDKKVAERNHIKLTLINQDNQGVSVARNSGISQATHEFVVFLDGDDFWHPQFLQQLKLLIETEPQAGIIGTAISHYYSNQPKEINPNFNFVGENKLSFDCYTAAQYFQQAIKSTLITASSVAIKRDFFAINPGFDPKIKFGEDIDVWFRAILFFGELYYLPTSFAFYSQEDQNAATKRNYRLDETLMPKIIKDDYYRFETIQDQLTFQAFHDFRIKWIYLRLYPLYKLKSNRKPICDLLAKAQRKFFLAKGVYLLPFGLLHQLSSSKPFKTLVSKYLNYCYHFIYR
ncbi:MAG: glycosyltransferase family A protein [Cyclobacteriaceae bacterium]